MRILCKECGKFLGETDTLGTNCRIMCRNCKKVVGRDGQLIKLTVDYLPPRKETK